MLLVFVYVFKFFYDNILCFFFILKKILVFIKIFECKLKYKILLLFVIIGFIFYL